MKGFERVDDMIKIVVFRGKDEVECTEWQREQKLVIGSIDISAVAKIRQMFEEE